MKNKKASIISILTTLFIFSTLFAIPIQAIPPSYDITGTWTWNYYIGGGIYTHTMMITSFDMATGDFSGNGYWNTNLGYTWDITGNVDGTTVTFHIDYTGINPTYYVDAVGTIDSGGVSMSGTATAPGQEATWNAEKEIPISLTFPPGSTAQAEIEILETLPPCIPDLPEALDIIPKISVKIISGEFDGVVQVCIEYDDSDFTGPEQELRLFISNCVDFNLDGTINGIDISLINKAIRYGGVTHSYEGVPFDVNNDDEVNEEDVLIVKEYATKGLIVNMDLYGLEQARLPWIDITTDVDIENNIICGQTDHFSIFRCR